MMKAAIEQQADPMKSLRLRTLFEGHGDRSNAN